MADPITWRILQTLGGRLQRITKAAGYHTDAGNQVQYEHREFSEDDTFPQIVVVLEEAPIDTSVGSSAYGSTLTVVAEAYVHVSLSDAQYLAHGVMEDISRAWAGMTRDELQDVTRFELTGERTILQRPEGLAYVVVQVRAQALYHARVTPP